MAGRRQRETVTENDDADGGDREDPLVGDRDGISVRSGDEFDYVLSRPDGGEFGFDAVEIPEVRELLEHTQGHG